MSCFRNVSILIVFLLIACNANGQDEYPTETVVQKGHSGQINVMKFSRDGRFMVTGSDDQNIKLWDVKSGREIRTFKGHQEGIQDLDINVSSGLIVSSAGTSSGSEIKVWDIYTGQPKKTVKGGEPLNLFNIDAMEWAFNIRALALAPDGNTLLWGEDNLGIQTGKITKRRSNDLIDTDWEPNTIVFSPDGKYFAVGGDVQNHRIAGRSDDVRIYTFPEKTLQKTLFFSNNSINKIIYSGDGRYLACLNTQLIWEGKPVNTTGIPLTKKKFSNRFSVVDLTTDKVIYEVEKPGWEIEDFAFSPNGQFLVFPDSHYDTLGFGKTNFVKNEKIYIYDVFNKNLKDSVDTGEFRIHSLGFTPDGQVLVANGNNMNFWSALNWERIRTVRPPRQIEDLHISKTGQINATKIVDNRLVSFTLDTKTLNFNSVDFPNYSFYQWVDENSYLTKEEKQLFLKSHDNLTKPRLLLDLKEVQEWENITRAALSPNMKTLVCMGDNKKEILVKDLLNNSPAQLLKGHRKPIICFEIGPNGKMLATGSDGNKILIWDLETGEVIHELLGHNGDILSLAFNSEGTMLASGASDNSAKIWDLKKGSRIHTFLGHTSDILSLDFNEEGTLLVTGSGDKLFGGKSEIILWDVKRKRKIRVVPGNEGYTSKVLFKNNRIYSIGFDPIIKVMENEKGNILYSYIPIGENDFILFTPDNYYMSTKMKFPIVHFAQGLNIYSFDNFDLKFNRPDIILERLESKNEKLKSAYHSLYIRRLKKLGFDESTLFDEFHLPEAYILLKEELPLVSNQAKISFSVGLKDDKQQLAKLMVWVNNVPLFGSEGSDISKDTQLYGKTGSYLNKTLNVNLSKGLNRVEISTLNSKGVESHRDQFEIIHKGDNSKPNLHLIIVGVSEYLDEAMNLNYAEKDARDVMTLFSDQKKLYQEVIMYPLFNENATRTNFLELKTRLNQSTVDDHVILFMAGHGLLDEYFNFNFAAYNLDFNDPAGNGISYDHIEAIMDGIPARKKLILIDACHSGEVDKIAIEEKALEVYNKRGGEGTLKSQSFEKLKMNVFKFYSVNNTSVEMMEELFTNLSRGSGSVIISAAAGNSYALESSEWNNGIFTYSILDGLNNVKADQNNDSIVTVTELKEFVIDQVFLLTNGQQKPTSRKENLEFDFEVWE